MHGTWEFWRDFFKLYQKHLSIEEKLEDVAKQKEGENLNHC